MTIVKMSKVSKIYNKGKKNQFKALNEIDFSVEEGDMIAIRGSSGAGKSTLLHIMGCMDTQTSGHYYFCGDYVKDMSQQQKAVIRNKKIGFVLQDFGLLEYQSVLDAVSLPLLFSNEIPVSKMKKHCLEYLAEVGLQGYATKVVNELSGGEKQRVAIARALVNNPSLILADEPTGALDEENAHNIMKLLQRLNADGRTVVIVTHDSDVASMCKTQITMKYGELRSDDEK